MDDLDFEAATFDEAFETLLRTTEFGTQIVGLFGSHDRGVIVLEEILRKPDAISYLDRLWVQGTPAARLYAICGYSFADPERFEWTSRSLFGRSECVEFHHSCIGSRSSLATALHLAAGAGLLKHLRECVTTQTAGVRWIDRSAAEVAADDLSAWLSCGAVVTIDAPGPAPWSCVQTAWGGIKLDRPAVNRESVSVAITLGKHPRKHVASAVCVRWISANLDRGQFLLGLGFGSCDAGDMEIDEYTVSFPKPRSGRYSIFYDDVAAGFPKLGEVNIE